MRRLESDCHCVGEQAIARVVPLRADPRHDMEPEPQRPDGGQSRHGKQSAKVAKALASSGNSAARTAAPPTPKVKDTSTQPELPLFC